MSQAEHVWQVELGERGQTLAGLVRARLGVSWAQAKKYVQTGKAYIDGACQTAIDARLEPGQTVALRMSAPRPKPRTQVRIVYEDTHVVVIDKPAGVPSVPYEARDSGTAMDLLREAWRKKYPDARRVPLHVVHRIDKATSGLLAFAKTKRAELGLAAQLRAHTMGREYLCVVHGRAPSQRIESRLVRDRGDGLRGSTGRTDQGKRAVSHVEAVEYIDQATLCRVVLETGKTHQIRIHLAERGHPLVGETVYIRDFLAAGRTPIDSPRLLLHARTLAFTHPVTGQEIACEAPLPGDFTDLLARLGWSGTLPPTTPRPRPA